jgi:hypothetical protein
VFSGKFIDDAYTRADWANPGQSAARLMSATPVAVPGTGRRPNALPRQTLPQALNQGL